MLRRLQFDSTTVRGDDAFHDEPHPRLFLMSFDCFPLAYIGPEVLMPLLSLLMAALGVILVFWRKCTGLCASVFRFVTGRTGDAGLDAEDETATLETGTAESDCD